MKTLLLVLLLFAGPVWAVQPNEMLDDPVLEERARDISKGLRCLQCRNENIDDSNATFARFVSCQFFLIGLNWFSFILCFICEFLLVLVIHFILFFICIYLSI